MPILKSAKKRLRQNLKRAALNRSKKRAVKEVYKKMMKLIIAKDWEEAEKLLPKYQKVVDKAAKRRVFHPNKAARLKSKMVKRILAIKNK